MIKTSKINHIIKVINKFFMKNLHIFNNRIELKTYNINLYHNLHKLNHKFYNPNLHQFINHNNNLLATNQMKNPFNINHNNSNSNKSLMVLHKNLKYNNNHQLVKVLQHLKLKNILLNKKIIHILNPNHKVKYHKEEITIYMMVNQ